MTPEQIKAIAKQAGGTVTLLGSTEVCIFTEGEIAEFVRLVRKQAFEERLPAASRSDEAAIYAKGKAGGREEAMADIRELLGITKENLK